MKTPTKILEKHELVPLHEKLTAEEKEKLLKEMSVNFKDLPKIYKSDPALAEMPEINQGDVIRISRKSSTAKETVFFRGVIDA